MLTIVDDLVECRLCGKRWRSLGHHLRKGHGISANDYRDQYGIRRSQPLTSTETRARIGDTIRRTIAAGNLDQHFAGNAKRAHAGSAASLKAVRDMREKGIDLPRGRTPRLNHDLIEAVVLAVEGGAKVATAVKRSGMAYSAYHAGLARHPDLKNRHDVARARTR